MTVEESNRNDCACGVPLLLAAKIIEEGIGDGSEWLDQP